MVNLKNEVTLLNQIKHENILKFIDKWRTEEHYYMLSEYCNGGNLK